MINNEILSFIKEQLAQGTTKDQVKDMLVGQGGWDAKDVEEAFETINFSGTSYPTVLKNAEAIAMKSDANEKKPAEPFVAVPQLSKPAMSNVRPAVFSPGMSHVEQSKSLEPTTPGSSFPFDSTARSPLGVREPFLTAREIFPASNTVPGNTPNALSGLRERIASGVGSAPVSAPILSPTIKEPMIEPSQISPVVSPIINPTPTVSPVVPMMETNNNFPPPQQPAAPASNMVHGIFSSFPSLHKATPMPSVQTAQSAPPIAMFPQARFNAIGNPHMSPTSAQLVAMQAQKPRGGRFFLGLIMLSIGIALGGISMNAYMKGYLNTPALNGMIEKGMDMIGLGTVTPPSLEAPATNESPTAPNISETAPDTAP